MSNCYFSSLQVFENDASGNALTEKLDGTKGQDLYVVANGNMFVQFISNTYYSRTGFSATYTYGKIPVLVCHSIFYPFEWLTLY